jgi:AraC-like DNA-binding protein
MSLTTGALLRRITETDLSVSAHKLATIILDGIAWKDGYNGLSRGTAAFTLASLAERMGISRQYLSNLLGELATSPLRLERRKPHGKYAPWLFRFGERIQSRSQDVVSSGGDTSLFRENSHKTIFAGKIDIGETQSVFLTRWAGLIKAAKTALPCWNVDTQVIWDRFIAFNRQRGNVSVPAGYLLGFMRRWRNAPKAVQQEVTVPEKAVPADPVQVELAALIRAAPVRNRQFHEADLRRAIGQEAYEARVVAAVARFRCLRFVASLAVHGRAVKDREILQ